MKLSQVRDKYYNGNKGAQKRDPELMEFMEQFEFDYYNMRGDLARMQAHQNMYDNIVNQEIWPTQTQLPIPFLFAAVHEALPSAMEYVFPRSKWINLIPDEPGEAERTENLEWALQMMIMHRMRLPWYAYPSVHSCFKCGIGYGAIEPYITTPPQIYQARAYANGQRIRNERILSVGRPKLALRYVNVTPGEIVVSKDGTEFNGHKRVTRAFRYQTYSEEGFRRLYKEIDSEAIDLKGNAEEIIAEARSLGFASDVPIETDIARLAGVDTLAINSKKDERIPVRIPVLKLYLENRHVWIVNGTQIIYDAKNKYQTMITPLIKWSAWPDGDRFFPPSAVEIAQKPALGLNLWVNLMFDMMTEQVKPVMLYNKAAFGSAPPERGPNGMVGVNGDVRFAATYMEKPSMDQGAFQMLEVLQRWYGHSTGRQIGDIAPGLLRAGVNAFEGVLQTTRGRERLANYVLEMGSIEDIVRTTLIYMQTLGEPESFVMREWDAELGREYDKRFSITHEDLLANYDIQLDLSDKHRASAMDQQMRLALFNALSQNPYYDQYENLRMLIADDYKFRRGMPTRQRVRELQEQQRQAQLAAVRQGAGIGPPPATQVEAAAAGLKANV